MNQVLQDKTAIITGGTAGIGKAIALKFAEAGAKVALFGTNPDRGAKAVQEIEQAGYPSQAVFYQVNVADSVEVKAAVNKALEALGRIDVLVNNAGVTRDQLLMKMTEEDWDVVMDVNIKSCYNTCHALVRPMMKARKGKIINMSSVVGLTGNPGQANYAASKAAMVGFTKALAKELASRSICVNCIAPGYITTDMTGALTDVQKEQSLSRIPLGRFGHPSEIADAALFLASHFSDYITGQVIAIDGGVGLG